MGQLSLTRLQLAFGRISGWLAGRAFLTKPAARIERLGTEYGGWECAVDRLDGGGTAICVGAGEDVSFDVILNARFALEVVCVDPTPRALAHVRELVFAHAAGQPMPIGAGSACYDLSRFAPERFRILPYAVWSSDGRLRLFAPRDPRHVSHSAVDMQGTGQYIVVDSRRLRSIVQECDIRELKLVKMDIEGAEYEVLRDLCASGIHAEQLLVEFEEVNRPRSILALPRLVRALRELAAAGYRLVSARGSNFVFLCAATADHTGALH